MDIERVKRNKNNFKIILKAVNDNGLLLKYASKRLKNNFRIVFAAVMNNGHSLEYSSKRLQNNKEIVIAAIQSSKPKNIDYEDNNMALKFASSKLRDDEEIIMIAIKNNAYSLYYTSERILDKKNIILTAVKNRYDDNDEGFLLDIIPEKLRSDRGFIFELFSITGLHSDMYHNDFICYKLSNDKDFILEAVKINPEILTISDLSYNVKDVIDCILINEKTLDHMYIIGFFGEFEDDIINIDLVELIHNLQYNYSIDNIQLDKLFLDNIEYISKTKYFNNILEHILQIKKDIFLKNYYKFLNVIINNEEYLLLCEEYYIKFISKEEFTSKYNEEKINDKEEREIKELILKYEKQNNNYKIIWY
jgi:hypothetical protein